MTASPSTGSNAAHSPSLDRVFVLADALGVSLAELFDDFDQAEAAV